ncbi:MAG TPA: alpha/beta hydrolase [Chthoniobacteraceae bacterium]
MKKSAFLSALLASLFIGCLTALADPLALDLWPGKPPGDVGISGDEKFIELKMDGKPYEVGGKPTKWLTNVSKPAIYVYAAPKDKATGGAMLICPGGGYHNLGWDVEGEEVAKWLNSIGITGVILKYRCPRRPGDVKGEPPLGPLLDAQRAVSLVRSKAEEWGIDPKKIGMVGFSAGGHLVGAAATNFDHRAYEPIDEIDKVSCRPDFGVMLYSGYFQVKDKDSNPALSPTIHTPEGIPPLFMVHNTDDTISDVANTVTMYEAMKQAHVPVELHIYPVGGHGFAVRDVHLPCVTWKDRCLDWLQTQGFLKRTSN